MFHEGMIIQDRTATAAIYITEFHFPNFIGICLFFVASMYNVDITQPVLEFVPETIFSGIKRAKPVSNV